MNLQALTHIFVYHFFNRTDLIPILADFGKPVPAKCDDLEALIAAHVLGPNKTPPVKLSYETRRGSTVTQGHFRIGSYTPVIFKKKEPAKTKWMCFDVDGLNHKDGLANPFAVATAIRDKLDQYGLCSLFEKSGSGQGWHIWILFDGPVPAADCRQLGQHVIQSLKDIDPFIELIEIFPKQDRAYKGMGNMVWLPFWYGAQNGGNRFYELTDEGELIKWDLIENLSIQQLN